jgi:hypothetical protein
MMVISQAVAALTITTSAAAIVLRACYFSQGFFSRHQRNAWLARLGDDDLLARGRPLDRLVLASCGLIGFDMAPPRSSIR